jgi:glycolate oxidase iron-sulfur subunit
VHVRDYVNLLLDDRAYAVKAARVALLTRDVAEIVAAEAERLSALLRPPAAAEPIAFHAPCTLQHGQKIRGVVEELLRAAGYRLTAVVDGHLCCGSAGTYSLLQPEIAGQLRDNKLAALTAGRPTRIATANIGCLQHLAGATEVPVQHWIELIDERLASSSG